MGKKTEWQTNFRLKKNKQTNKETSKQLQRKWDIAGLMQKVNSR